MKESFKYAIAMEEKNGGPFRKNGTKNKTLHFSWTALALGLIAITQIPLALKASLDITCMANLSKTNNINFLWCRE